MNQVINMELSLKYGNPISGHFVQGHVDTTSKLKKRKFTLNHGIYIFQLIKILRNYLSIKDQSQ